jgi:hypothetical protein
MKTNIHFLSCLAHFFIEWEMFQTKAVEKIRTHFLCSITFFFVNRTVYEKMWRNIVESGRSQMTIWRMRIACWITMATNTHLGCVILIAFPLQWLHERASMLRYTYTTCLCVTTHKSKIKKSLPYSVPHWLVGGGPIAGGKAAWTWSSPLNTV